jgi:hypothetical protein
MSGAKHPLPDTPSWRGAYLKSTGINLPLPYHPGLFRRSSHQSHLNGCKSGFDFCLNLHEAQIKFYRDILKKIY